MPSHKKKEIVPGELEDGSFDLSDSTPEPDEVFLTEVEATAAPETASSDVDPELVEQLRQEVQDAVDARKRALADFANFQRRAADNEDRAQDVATSAVIRAFIPVLDHLEMALAQGESEITVEQLMDGVRLLKMEMLKAFQQFDVEEIRPEPKAEFDPNEHQAMMRQQTDDQPSNTVVSVLQVGYRRDEVVIRPASVSVAAPTDGK